MTPIFCGVSYWIGAVSSILTSIASVEEVQSDEPRQFLLNKNQGTKFEKVNLGVNLGAKLLPSDILLYLSHYRPPAINSSKAFPQVNHLRKFSQGMNTISQVLKHCVHIQY